jgi:hypothetical protein
MDERISQMIQDLPPHLKAQLRGKGVGGGAFHGEPELKLSPDFNQRLWARIHKFEAAQAAERERAERADDPKRSGDTGDSPSPLPLAASPKRGGGK